MEFSCCTRRTVTRRFASTHSVHVGMSADAVIAEIKKSGLRGHGGAGFPVGIKWASLASDPCPTKYLACNATEGEPGTYKDRTMMHRNPYQLLEGVAIAVHAMNAQKAFIAMASRAGYCCNRMDTVLSFKLATARSSRPSPLKSPATIESGLFPTV